MGYIFICKKCGDIKSIDWKVGTRHLTCNKCAEPMDWSNAFPPQSVIDFRNTVDSLFELSKEHDKQNLDIHYDVKNTLIMMIPYGKLLMINFLMKQENI